MDTDGPNSVLPPLPEFPSFDHDADDPRRKLSFSMGDQSFEPAPTKSKPETLRVYVRVRPPAEGTTGSVEVRDGSSVVMHTAKNSAQGASELNEHSFSFDSVFDQSAKQHEVFEAAMEPQVGALLKGRDTMTFAYGITNAGKTHTIQGSRTGEKRGMLPRALEAIFAALEQHRAHAAALAEGAEPPAEAAGVSMGLDAACSYELRASFLEVYGSDAYDLLAPSEERGPHGERKRTVLKLREDAGKGKVSVEGLREVELPDLETAQTALEMGWQARSAASNGINDESSRSHAVLCVKLICAKPGSATPPTATRLCVVDLAGAERQKKTQSHGARFGEATSINKDLMVLGHCLRDLRWNQSHPRQTQRVPPFRDSRITMLFRDYLTGGGQTVVLAAVNPAQENAVGTLDTLRFAAVASTVKTVAAPPRPKGSAARPSATLPRCATGAPYAAAPLPLVSEDSSDSLSSSMRSSAEGCVAEGWKEAAAAEGPVAAALREQVRLLGERLEAMEEAEATLERRVREQAMEEAKELIHSREIEMEQRLEDQHARMEELAEKRLALVRKKLEGESGSQSMAAHMELVQQMKSSQRTAAVHVQQLAQAQQEIDALRADNGRLETERKAAEQQAQQQQEQLHAEAERAAGLQAAAASDTAAGDKHAHEKAAIAARLAQLQEHQARADAAEQLARDAQHEAAEAHKRAKSDAARADAAEAAAEASADEAAAARREAEAARAALQTERGAAARSGAAVEEARAALEAERGTSHALQAQVAELRARLSNVVEMGALGGKAQQQQAVDAANAAVVATAAAAAAAAAATAPNAAAAAAPAPPPPKRVPSHRPVLVSVGEDEVVMPSPPRGPAPAPKQPLGELNAAAVQSPPKRASRRNSKAAATAAVAAPPAAEAPAAAVDTSKQSKLKQIGTKMFSRKPAAANNETRWIDKAFSGVDSLRHSEGSGESGSDRLETSGPSFGRATSLPKGAPEPTPIARRTRAGRRSHAQQQVTVGA